MLQDSKRPTFFIRIQRWVRTHKKASYLILGGVLILAASVGAYALLRPAPEPEPQPVVTQPEPEPEPIVYYSPLTGEKVAKQSDELAAVTAVMIENSPDARPQSGLKQAGVVYEAIAEGGITRFLALYQNKKPQLIGPVRSLRMYYVDWLAPYNPSVAHVGGSYKALKEVRNGRYRDIDEFFNPGAYWRATDRYAPHNVYTSFKNLDALNKKKGYTTSEFESFARVDGEPAKTPTATNIQINFSSPTYNTTYKYDKKNNRYLRNLAGAAHKDRESGQITPSVVIALRVNMKHVMEDGYREQITTTGSGKAVLFQNGTAKNVTWRKAKRSSPLTLTDSEGKEIPLVRGQTWIAAVPTSGGGSVTWQ